MKQFQFYKYGMWCLLVLNLSLVAFFFLTKPKHPAPPNNGKKRAASILKLDKQQQDIFSDYADQHIRQVKGIEHQQRDLLKSYFNTLIDATANIDSDSLIIQIIQLEQEKIETTYQHFQDVKTILKQEQQEYFEAFINHVLRIFSNERNNPPPSPRRD